MAQKIFNLHESGGKIGDIISDLNFKKIMLIVDKSYPYLSIKLDIESTLSQNVFFDDFSPNPLYKDVCTGIERFNSEKCDAILVVGGGSAIDVAKCVKLFCKMDPSVNYLKQKYIDSQIPLVAIPTTAGTGSESTRFAVIYFNGEKQSISHDSIIPNYAILDSRVLKTLPPYQKKCTLLDALCQGIESWWSVNSTEDSRIYSQKAVEGILTNYHNYIYHDDENATEAIMNAANTSGQAINITQTTAAHAMSYKITSLYNLPHGHAVAICLPHIWEYMNRHMENCIDTRGKQYLKNTFTEIAIGMSACSVELAIDKFNNLLFELGISAPKIKSDSDIDILSSSVNTTRLKNNPIALDHETLRKLYKKIIITKGLKNET